MATYLEEGLLCLTDEELLKKIRRRIMWHEKRIRYSSTVKAAIVNLRRKRRIDDDDESEVSLVFQTDIQHAVSSGLSRVVPGSAERALADHAWSCVIRGPSKGDGPALKVWVFLSDDDAELLRIDQFLLCE